MATPSADSTPLALSELVKETETSAIDDFVALMKGQFGENSPSKSKSPKSLVPKGVWVWIKRLKDPALFADGKTHVCILCWLRIHLTERKVLSVRTG